MRRLSRYGWHVVEPPPRPVLFVNPRSGGGRAAEAGLVERARERGIRTVVLEPQQNLGALVAEAVADGAGALGTAGGDGSLAVVAAAARAHGLPSCVPVGTRNHPSGLGTLMATRWSRSYESEVAYGYAHRLPEPRAT